MELEKLKTKLNTLDTLNTLYIFYGSQTGNGQDLALRFSRYINQRVLDVKSSSLDNFFTFVDPSQPCVVMFIVSTTGNGEEPDNMKPFWKFIMQKKLHPLYFTNLSFAIIGLGDSSYQNYNVVGKKLNRRLVQLGAVPLLPMVLGDDQHELGPEAQINPWLVHFWEKVRLKLNLPDDFMELNKCEPFPSMFAVELCDDDDDDDDSNVLSDVELIQYKKPSVHNSKVYNAVLNKNIRVTGNEHFQDVRLFEFLIEDQKLEYTAGDIAIVRPSNLEENVKEFLEIFKAVDPSQYIKINPRDSKQKLPKELPPKCTIEYLARHYWDLSSIPRRSFFELFRFFSTSELEKEKMMEFCSAEGQEDLYNYTTRPRRTLLEVLKDFNNTTPHVPLNFWFDLMPTIKTRSFSICSSCKLNPGKLELLVAVVNYKTRLQKPRLGLCSTWLSRLKPGENLHLLIKKGTFLIPQDNTPLIMVGPGTGCAPFRSFIQDRVAKNIGNNYLFFGCRNVLSDFYFAEEWQDLASKHLLSFFVAFSRDQEYKIYVQHKILEQKSLFWELLDHQGAYVYIAGNAGQMSQDVREAIETIIVNTGGKTKEEAATYIKRLTSSKRLQSEIW